MAKNRPYETLTVGEEASITRVCTANDLFVFAHASGNVNPLHLPEQDGDGDGAPDAIAPSMWVGGLISSVLGNVLPGAGTLYESQHLRFGSRVHVGDTLRVNVKVVEKKPDRRVVMATRVTSNGGVAVAEGEAVVIAPDRLIETDYDSIPGLIVERHVHIGRLIEACAALPPLATAVVVPDEPNSLGGALLGREEGLIAPVLIGIPDDIERTAAEMGASLDGIEILAAGDDDEASSLAVALVHEGRAEAIMKGHLHSDRLLSAVVKRKGGLRTNRRLSHAFVMDVPGLEHLLMVTDAAINISPELETKVDIVQNAIHLAQSLGIPEPKVGILSAVEIVNPKIPSTLDAAILSKMAERGQIRGGLVDGPLAMDNAISLAAARNKGITSLVAGRADVLVVPNLEAGNMLAKELAFVAHAEGAGLVLGAQVPVMLTSRADDERSRLASCAVAALYRYWLREGKPLPLPEPTE